MGERKENQTDLRKTTNYAREKGKSNRSEKND